MAHVIRSRMGTPLVLLGLLLSFPAGRARAQQCLGDCDGSGTVGSGDLTKIIAIINYCPCSAPALGGDPAGCAALPGGSDKQCTAADRNNSGCITAGELTGVIADIMNYATGCPPGPTPTNTAVPPPSATATSPVVVPTATPTNTPVTPGATNTPVTPPTATKTPVTPATNTPPQATATPTNTPPGTAAVCGNGAVETGEDCDPGGVCIGGDNAGTPCTAESNCMGEGVCEAGPNGLQACDGDADCTKSRCVHCKTFGGVSVAGGHTCAANCTYETQIQSNLVTGAVNPVGNIIQAGTSISVVRSSGPIPVPPLKLAGTNVIWIGKEKDGKLPVRVHAGDGKVTGPTPGVDGIQVSTLACACVRAVVAQTCGGVLIKKDGSPALDCTEEFRPGKCATPKPCTVATTTTDCFAGEVCDNAVCTCHARDAATECPGTGNSCVVPDPCVVAGDKPCAFVHGAGNTASGLIGCDGLDDTNLNASQDAGNSAAPPPPTPPPGSGPAILQLRNACECSSSSDCGGTLTCDSNHRCAGCTSDTDCLSSATNAALCVCPGSNAQLPGTAPTPAHCATPGSGTCVNQGCVQNSDCPGTLTCESGPPGSAVIVNSTAIGQSPTGQLCVLPTKTPGPLYGPDHKWCSDDDPETARGVPQTLPSVTGFATGIVTNEYNNGATPKILGPFSIIGKPLDCNSLLAPTPSNPGAGLAGCFTAINQPAIANIVTINVQYTQ